MQDHNLDYSNYHFPGLDNGTTAGEDVERDWVKIGIRLGICITGLLGNLLVIFIVLVLKEYKKSVTHWYILQLAIADFIFLLTIPAKIEEDYHDSWIHSSALCKANETILFLNYYASTLFLTIISIDRYIAMCHRSNKNMQRFRTPVASWIITACIWCVGLLLCIPIMMYSNKAGIAPYCKCSYEFPRYEPTPEETCKNEGFVTEEDMKMCLDLMPAVEHTESCITLSDSFIFDTKDFEEYYDSDLLSYGDIEKTFEELYEGDIGLHKDLDYTFYDYEGKNTTYLELLAKKGVSPVCHYWDQGVAWRAYLIFNFVCMFLLPLIVMGYCYIMLATKVNRDDSNNNNNISENGTVSTTENGAHSANNNINSEVATTSNTADIKKYRVNLKLSSDRRRITVLCGLLVALFVVCWLPFHAVHMAKIQGIMITWNDHKWCSLLSTVASIMAISNSALNPYFYNFFGILFKYRISDDKSL